MISRSESAEGFGLSGHSGQKARRGRRLRWGRDSRWHRGHDGNTRAGERQFNWRRVGRRRYGGQNDRRVLLGRSRLVFYDSRLITGRRPRDPSPSRPIRSDRCTNFHIPEGRRRRVSRLAVAVQRSTAEFHSALKTQRAHELNFAVANLFFEPTPSPYEWEVLQRPKGYFARRAGILEPDREA